MSNTEMQFLKGAGKAFELVRTIANHVLARGGTEEHMLQILKSPQGPYLVSQLAGVLVGWSVTVERPKPEVVRDKRVPIKARRVALNELDDVAVALEILMDEQENESDLTTAAVAQIFALGGERREEMLKGVALSRRLECSRTAVTLMERQDTLLEVARLAPQLTTRLEAVGRLNGRYLCEVVTSENWQVRLCAVEKLCDKEVLNELKDSDLCRDVRLAARARLTKLGWAAS